MALINFAYGAAPAFNVRAVEAGDAAEMVSRLRNEAAAAVAAGDSTLGDFQLAGCGSGPQWQAWMVTGNSSPTPIQMSLQEAVFVADVAGNPTEAVFYVKKRLAELVPAPAEIFKIVVAGAGDGPTYMAIALALVEPR